MNYFNTLNSINVNDKVEKKSHGSTTLSYLSWAWAWGEVKKFDQRAFYTIYENAEGLNYHHDGKTAWVKTGVTVHFPVPYKVDGEEAVRLYELEHIEYLPVMDYRNNSIPLEKITSTDVNKAIQRSLTKACARHGLGLYIYAGEDIPEDEQKKLKETITELEALVSLCKRKGLDVAETLPGGVENLTGEQYAKAVKRFGTMKDKE